MNHSPFIAMGHQQIVSADCLKIYG